MCRLYALAEPLDPNTVEGFNSRIRVASLSSIRCTYQRCTSYTLSEDGKVFSRILVRAGFSQVYSGARRWAPSVPAQLAQFDWPYLVGICHE